MGFFTLFGDGNYTWDSNPYHEYREATTYKDVYFEYTKIKDANPPPKNIVNPLYQETIKPYTFNVNSTTNTHSILNGHKIAYDQSRPEFCGYTFVQIIKIGNHSIPINSKVVISYTTSLLTIAKVPLYLNSPFSPNYVINAINGTITFTTVRKIEKTEEIPIFVQFTNKCTSNQVATICTAVIDKSGTTIVKEKCRSFTIQNNNPFDPNWLDIKSQICADPVNYKKHMVTGCFYYYSNGDNTKRKVTLTLDGISSNILSLTPRSNPNYTAKPQRRSQQLIYESCASSKPCHKIDGIGDTRTRNDVLECITFDLILLPVTNATQDVVIDFTSHFEGLASFTSTLRIPITCDSNDTTHNYIPIPVELEHLNSDSTHKSAQN